MDTAEPPASRQRPKDLYLAVLTLGECLIEAPLGRRANLQVKKRPRSDTRHLAAKSRAGSQGAAKDPDSTLEDLEQYNYYVLAPLNSNWSSTAIGGSIVDF